MASGLGAGAPAETGIGAALFAGRLGRRLGLPEDECAELFYSSLLRFIGCAVGVPDATGLAIGDVEGFQRGLAMSDLTDVKDVVARLDENLAIDAPAEDRRAAIATIGEAAGSVEVRDALTQPHCDLGAQLATDLGLPPVIAEAMNQVYERWDGGGSPTRMSGEAICLAARVMHITGSFELVRRSVGVESAFGIVRDRKGGQFDPRLCDAIDGCRNELMRGLDSPALLDTFLEEAPGNWQMETDNLVSAAKACAHTVDLRSVYTLGHSVGVAELAAKAGECAGLEEDLCDELLIAGYLHDLGRVGVPTAIWDKPSELTRSEWAKVEQHPFLTDNILKASPALSKYARLASSHHERNDGSGYHRGIENPDLQCSILAAADCYHAMLEDRPYRGALGPEKASEELIAMADNGKLNRMAVRAVLDAVAGRRAGSRSLPAGLTTREAEVICLMAQGMTNKEIADKLCISAKTVEHHVGHIYDKIGSRTRPSAAMFAVAHGLCTKLGA